MNKTVLFSALALATIVHIGCNDGDDGFEPPYESYEPTYIDGLTLGNYPKVDGSTSTEPLNKIIACKLLGIDYEWGSEYSVSGDYIFYIGTRGVIPQVSHDSVDMLNDRVKSSQTHNSFINLIDGEADIILSARKMSQDEKDHADAAGVSLIETPIALDAFIFIVHTGNAIKSLTAKQIQDIYTGKITHWNEVGGRWSIYEDGWDENTIEYHRGLAEGYGPIIPFVRNANSGSQELMELLVMKGLKIGEFAENYYEILFTMAGPRDAVMRTPGAICYTVYYYKEYITESGGGVKTIGVNGIQPNRQSIANRTYPYVAEVYAAIRSDLDKSSMAYKLYEWLQTGYGKQVIAESGYVPY